MSMVLPIPAPEGRPQSKGTGPAVVPGRSCSISLRYTVKCAFSRARDMTDTSNAVRSSIRSPTVLV